MSSGDIEESLTRHVIRPSISQAQAGVNKRLLCQVCNKNFASSTTLYIHRKRSGHRLVKKIGQYVCKICDKRFLHIQGLHNHEHTIHFFKKQKYPRNFSCQEKGCETKYTQIKLLVEHLKEVHGFELDYVDVTFKNEAEFLKWKQDLEVFSRTKFVQKSGTKRTDVGTTQYIYCSRSGFDRRVSDRKKNCKSKKLNLYCTCHIIISKSNQTQDIRVRCCLNHYGHDTNVEELCLSDRDKEFVLNKVRLGVSVDNILNGIATNVGPLLKRIDLLTRKDIYNIAKRAGMKLAENADADDTTNLRLLIEELQLNENNPILACKLSGDKDNNSELTGNNNCLHYDDLFLVFQTNFQKNMLQEFDNSIVYLDVMDSTNGYGYKLISIIFKDDYGEGVPVAWCISNRDDAIILTKFFEYVKVSSGVIEPTFFISSRDAPHYFDSWINVFGGSPKKRLCSWHVHNAWSQNLHHIQDPAVRADVLQVLEFLIEETDINTFNAYLKNFIDQLEEDDKTKKFASYFRNFYQHRADQWAYCYSQGVITNMETVCDTFHKVVNHQAKEGKINKRVDKLVYMLLKFQRQKVVAIEKEKPISAITEILNRHDNTCNRSFNLISGSVDEKEFKIKAEDDSDGKEYLVKFKNIVCNCELRCSKCDICVHGAVCDCSDYLLYGTICEHIHLLQWYRSSDRSDENNQLDADHSSEATDETMIAENEVDDTVTLDISKFKECLVNKCFEVVESIKTTDSVDILSDVDKYLKIVSDLFNLH